MVAVPIIVDLGSTYAGLRCGIIRLIVASGGITEEHVSKVLRTPVSKARETIRRMEDEGTVMTMTVDGKKRSFLTDHGYWSMKMMEDAVLRDECLRDIPYPQIRNESV